ncbi:MAG: hypothetical protein A2W11_07420 [Ignavibacteria bacterium RBG_16_35_7]|nr:MAG: hypothetical protein A2W11_07420 [Ignavibacteria bacterium RBG_16_35_7]
MFEKTWGMPYNNFIVYADELSNGDYILIGRCSLFADAMSPYPPQFYMCRMDQNGNILWERNYGNPNEWDQQQTVIKTKNENYLIAGVSLTANYFPSLLELDPNGNVIFFKVYDADYTGGALSVAETKDSCFIMACVLGVPQNSPTLIKADRNGNEIWRKRQDSLVNYSPEIIRATSDSGFLVVGGAYTYNAYIAKYFSDGNLQWIKYPYGRNDTVGCTIAGLFTHEDCTFEMPFAEENTTTTFTDTHWKTFDSNGNQVNDNIIISNFALDFNSQFNFGIPDYDMGDSVFISTSNPYAFGTQWIMEVDKNKNVTYKTRITEPDSSSKFLINTIRTSDGGYLSVGQMFEPNDDWGRFYVVKFGPDGRYQSDEFLESINAYPNPSADGNMSLTFDMTKDDNVQVDIYTSEGKLIYSNSIFCSANSHTELPVRLYEISANGGMYILQARTSDAVIRKKLVVMRQN